MEPDATGRGAEVPRRARRDSLQSEWAACAACRNARRSIERRGRGFRSGAGREGRCLRRRGRDAERNARVVTPRIRHLRGLPGGTLRRLTSTKSYTSSRPGCTGRARKEPEQVIPGVSRMHVPSTRRPEPVLRSRPLSRGMCSLRESSQNPEALDRYPNLPGEAPPYAPKRSFPHPFGQSEQKAASKSREIARVSRGFTRSPCPADA